MIFVFDVETNCAPWQKPIHVLQFASFGINEDGEIFETTNVTFKLPSGVEIDPDTSKIHGITQEDTLDCEPIEHKHLESILYSLTQAERIIGHNVKFDLRIIENEYKLHQDKLPFVDFEALKNKLFCTMTSSRLHCKIPNKGKAGYKQPKLTELYRFLFNEDFDGAHDALADVKATWDCVRELNARGVIKT